MQVRSRARSLPEVDGGYGANTQHRAKRIQQREEETRMRLKGQGSNTMLWIAAIVVLIVVVGLAYYFLVLAPR